MATPLAVAKLFPEALYPHVGTAARGSRLVPGSQKKQTLRNKRD